MIPAYPANTQQTKHRINSSIWFTRFSEAYPPLGLGEQIGERVYFENMIHVQIMR